MDDIERDLAWHGTDTVPTRSEVTGPPTASATSAGDQEVQELASNPELTVVVCDDARNVRDRLVGMLNRLRGVRIAGEADDASSALEMAASLNPDVLILDLKLPDGSGLDALRSIREMHPGITVIILTNHANALYRRACLEAGARYFFDKSAEFDQVGAVLSRMISHR